VPADAHENVSSPWWTVHQATVSLTTAGKKSFGQGDSSVPAGWKVYQCPHRGSLTTSRPGTKKSGSKLVRGGEIREYYSR